MQPQSPKRSTGDPEKQQQEQRTSDQGAPTAETHTSGLHSEVAKVADDKDDVLGDSLVLATSANAMQSGSTVLDFIEPQETQVEFYNYSPV